MIVVRVGGEVLSDQEPEIVDRRDGCLPCARERHVIEVFAIAGVELHCDEAIAEEIRMREASATKKTISNFMRCHETLAVRE